MKKPGQRVMHSYLQSPPSRHVARGAAFAMCLGLMLAGCTTYRPIDEGARVPWAKALIATQGGPIDNSRYRVARGDALSSIAQRYDVRMSTLAAANNIQAPYTLYPGEVLRIPEDAPLPARRPAIKQTSLPPVETAGVTSEPATSPIETAKARVSGSTYSWTRKTEPKPVVEGERHVVSEGESLALIAVRHKLTLGELVATNRIDPPYKVLPGQVLIIPRQESQSARAEARTQEAARPASSIAPAPPLSDQGFMWPVLGEMIGTFEQRGAGGRSGGVNIAARKGSPVRASENGIVAYAGEAVSGYGRLVMLRHAEGYVTLYAHNDTVLVGEGDVVRRGQTIAEVGNSGDVVESQLHFELRRGKAPVDPADMIAGLPGRQLGQL
ncbi:MAG: peptidoglycan DD-metalloendopeptidase family protein [Pseudomonadota bacterium]